MKPKYSLVRVRASRRLFVPTIFASAFVFALAGMKAVQGQTTRYWDSNGTTAGFGTAGGTWTAPTVSRWSTTAAGTGTPGASVTTAVNDPLFFGTNTTGQGLAGGTITVTGTVNAGSLTFGSQSTTAITLSGGTINMQAAGTVTVGASITHVISSVISGAATSFTKAGTGNLRLNGVNSLTGQVIVSGGILQIGSYTGLSSASALTVSGGAANLQLVQVGTGATTNTIDRALSLHGTLSIAGGSAAAGQTAANTLNQTMSGNITLAGNSTISNNGNSRFTIDGQINLGGNTLTYQADGTGSRINSGIIGSGGSLTKTSAQDLSLFGSNSYTGATTVTGGALSVVNAAPFGTVAGADGTSGIAIGAGATLSSATTGSNPSTTIVAPITLSGTGNTNLRIGQGAASNTHSFNINGAIGGSTGNLVFTTATAGFGNGTSAFVLGAPSTYTGNTLITTGNGGNNPVTVRAGTGVTNALPATTILSFTGGTGGGSGRLLQYDMNGNDQTLAGLTNTVASLRNQRFVNNGALATLTINNSTDMSFGGSDLTSGSTTRAQINGAINLTKSGAGIFTLGGTLDGGATAGGHTHTGATKVLGGILVLGETLALQNSALDTSGSIVGDLTNGLRATPTTLRLGGLTGNKNLADVFTTDQGGYNTLTDLTLNPGSGVTNTYAANMGNGAGNLTLTKIGAGTQVLTGTNTYSGITTINAGTLALEGGTAISDSGAVALANAAGATLQLNSNETIGAISGGGITGGKVNLQANTLTAGDASNTTFDGVLEGAGGGLIKQGSGVLTLTNTHTYSGATTINAGKLIVNGNIGTSSTSLNAGILTGNGTVGSVTVANSVNAIISNNDGVPGLALTTGALNFSGAATINSASASTAATIVVSSLSTNAAGTVTINPSGIWTSGATHELISYGGGSIGGAGFGQFVLGTVSGLTARQSVSALADSGSAITLNVIGDTPVWTGAGSATWSTATVNDDTGPNDWVRKTAKTGTNFWATDGVEFNDSYDLGAGAVAATNTTVTISGGVAPSATTFNNSLVNYTIGSNDATGITSGSLIKNGTGTVTINNENTYTGVTAINAGTVQIGNVGALGAVGVIAFGGGTLQYGTGITTDLSARFSNNASQSYKVDTNGNDVSFATALSSSGGSLSKEGLGVLTLTTTNTYTGSTAINGGVLQLGNGGTTGALTGTTGITSSGTGTLLINRSNAFSQLTDLNDQVISGAGLSVTKAGTGTATLSGANTYDGTTVVNEGTLAITSNSALGSLVGATTINGGNGANSVNLSLNTATSDLTIAENLNLFGSVAGRAQVTNSSALNHTFTGAIDVSSDTNLAQFTSSGAGSITISGDISGSLSNGAVLFLRGTSTSGLNRITGSINLTGGNLAKTDAGTWLLGATGKTYNWVDTVVANGRVNLGAANVLPAATQVLMGENAARTPILDLNGFSQTVGGIAYSGLSGTATGLRTITNSDITNAAVFTINNATDNNSGLAAANSVVLTGNLSLVKQGEGKLTLRATNTYTGDTTVGAGTLEIASNLIANSPNIVIGDGATLNCTGGFSAAAGQDISGTGATGFFSTSSTGLITAGGTSISSTGSLTFSRLDFRGEDNVISGGSIQSGSGGNLMRGLLVGNSTSGTLTISGGTLTTSGGATNSDLIANTSGAGAPVASLIINGGSYINTANSGKTQLGNGGTAAGTANLTLTAGSATIHNLDYNLGTFVGNTGTVNLDGGTLTVSSLTSSGGTNRIFNFNGGQFVAGGSAFSIGSGLTLNVKDGGAKIDTNGNSFAINDALLNAGTGGLTKTGLGTLTLSGLNTYVGGTTVNAGALRFSSAVSAATNVTVADGAKAGALVAATDGQWVNAGNLTLQNNGTVLADYGSTLPSTTVAPISVTNFDIGTTPGVELAGASVPSMLVNQTYPLITWSGTGPVNASAFTLRTHRLAGTFSISSNTLFLTVTNNASGAPISWNTGNGAWDTSTPNWVDSTLAPTAYVDTLDTVLLGDAAGATGNPQITLASAVSPVAVTMNTSGRNYTISGAGAIGGSGGLNLLSTNLGTLTLATANHSFSGGTLINGGTLALGDTSNTLPDSGAVTVDGATAVLSLGANSDTVGVVTLKNDAAITGSAGILTGSSYNLESGSISAGLGGSGSVTKTTAGTVILSGANTYTGETNLNGGTLVAANANALSSSSLVLISTAAGSGTLQLATDTSVAPFVLSASSSFPGKIVSDRATPGAGITHELGAANLANNTWTIESGTSVTSGTAAVSLASINLTAGSTGSCILNPTTATLLIPGAVNIGSNNHAKTLELSGQSTGNAISGDITNGLNTLSVSKTGTSTWSLSGLNAYTGATTIDQGTLLFATNDQILAGGLTFGASMGSANVGTLDLSSVSANFNGALTVQTNSASASNILIGAAETLTINGGLTMSNTADAAQTRLTMTGGGALVVNGATITVGANASGTSISGEAHLDLSALSSFTAAVTTNFVIQASGDNSATDSSSLTLSNGANSITSPAIRVGNSSTGSTQRLWLGAGTNAIQTDLINLGAGSRDDGVIDFAGTGGTVSLRDQLGTARVASVNMGVQSAQSTGYTTANVIDFTGNTADVAIGTFATSLGAKTAGNTNDLRFDSGILDIRSINMAFAKGTGNSTNRITIGGGTVNLGGSTAFSDAGTGTLTLATAGAGSLTITGGTVTSTADLIKGVGGTGTATVTLSGGTLDMGGKSIGTVLDTVALVIQSGTLSNLGEVNGGGALTKSGTGTLILSGTNTYTGAATTNGGTLSITGTLNPLSSLVSGNSTITYSGAAPQSVSGLTINSGLSTITNTNAGATNVLNVGAITRNAGGIVNFANATATDNVIQTTTANTNGILGTWAFVGTDFAMNDGSGNIVAYSGYADVTRLNPGIIADVASSNVRIIEGSGSPGNITLGAPITTINTLTQSDSGGTSAATIDTSAGTLRTDAIVMTTAAGSLTVGTAPDSGILTPATAGGDLVLTNNSVGNPLTMNSGIVDNTTASALLKRGDGTVILGGTNTYTGTTTVNGGTLRLAGSLASPSALVVNGTLQTAGNLPATTAVTVSGTSTLDLFGASQTVASLANVEGNTLTNSSTGTHASTATAPGSPALTDALTITAPITANSLPLLVTDGPTRKTQVVMNNANGNATATLTNNANTFSGGVVLAHNATNGTRLLLNGTNGGVVGTGPVIIGQANTDRAGVYFSAATAFANDLVFNTAIGTDRVGVRVDAAVTLSGKITANLAPATFTSNSGIAGQVTITGQVTGASGLVLDITSLAAAATNFTVTLNNAGTPNDYAGDTVINLNAASGKSATLNLGAAEQIPHGAATGNVVISSNGTGVGTLNLAGFNETINGLSGSGVVDSGTGAPTLTLGANNGSAVFTGVISNSDGTLALVKTGTGTQTLSGANTYTGSTSVSQGTLALVGGSQASPITVSAGASLSFEIGSPTTSSSSFDLTTGTIKISGTPSAASHTLITSSTGITGTPTLDAPVPGYELKVVGNSLVLQQAGYGSWAALNGAGANLNEDHDSDGVANGVEYFLGGPNGNTTGFTVLPGVTNTAGALSVTWVMGTGYAGVYGTDFSVETSETLTGIWNTETSGVNVVVSGSNVTYTFPAPLGTKKFARLKVTAP